MKIENLNDLFLHTLQDIYFAEKQIVKALPKMVKKTDSPQLAKALESHLTETEMQVGRLEQVFEMLGEKPKATKCPAIEGIIKEADELIADIADPDTRDAGMLAALHTIAALGQTPVGTTLSSMLAEYDRYAASGEINTEVADQAAVSARIKEAFATRGALDELDGFTIDAGDWWFNVRASNTEPLVRLNVEASDPELMVRIRDEALALIRQ